MPSSPTSSSTPASHSPSTTPADAAAPIQTSDFEVLDHTQTTLSRLFIHYGDQVKAPPPALIAQPSSSPPIQVHPTRGLYLASLHLWLTFNTHIQDLLIDLGPPSSITPKADDKMRIHAGGADDGGGGGGVGGGAGGGGGGGVDVFYNYFEWGLDVLMEGRSGRMVKAIVHCNMPGGREFGQYQRAECVVVMGAAGGKRGVVGGGAGGGVEEGGSVVGVGGGARWVEVERVDTGVGGGGESRDVEWGRGEGVEPLWVDHAVRDARGAVRGAQIGISAEHHAVQRHLIYNRCTEEKGWAMHHPSCKHKQGDVVAQQV